MVFGNILETMADDEYEGWSVSDLKKLLAVRGVDYSNVLERSELVALASKGVSTNTTASNVSSTKSSYSGGGSGGYSSWWERKPLEPEVRKLNFFRLLGFFLRVFHVPQPDYASMTPEDALKLKRSRYSCDMLDSLLLIPHFRPFLSSHAVHCQSSHASPPHFLSDLRCVLQAPAL